jgi:hypothetical protein
MVDDCIGAVSTAPLPDDMVRRVVRGVLDAEGLPADEVTVGCVVDGMGRELPGLLARAWAGQPVSDFGVPPVSRTPTLRGSPRGRESVCRRCRRIRRSSAVERSSW